MNRKISIALWDDTFLRPFTDAFTDSDMFDVIITTQERCEQLALAGMVDVALMRSHMVFLHEDDLDVYGSSAISTWRFPYARLVLQAPIGTPVTSIQYRNNDQMHAIVSRIVLNEHYEFEPTFAIAEDPSIDGDSTGAIITGESILSGTTILDLGQEWFELTGYPMVWGLFAVGKGSHTSEVAEELTRVVSRFKMENDETSLNSEDYRLEEFYSGDIRVGYDDLVTASLTEFSQYLYFYNIVDEPVSVPVIADDEVQRADDG